MLFSRQRVLGQPCGRPQDGRRGPGAFPDKLAARAALLPRAAICPQLAAPGSSKSDPGGARPVLSFGIENDPVRRLPRVVSWVSKMQRFWASKNVRVRALQGDPPTRDPNRRRVALGGRRAVMTTVLPPRCPAPVAVRIAERPKCASDPHVVCALQCGSRKSYLDRRLACCGAVVGPAGCSSYESVPDRGPSARRETAAAPAEAGGARVNRRRAEV